MFELRMFTSPLANANNVCLELKEDECRRDNPTQTRQGENKIFWVKKESETEITEAIRQLIAIVIVLVDNSFRWSLR